MCNSDPINTTSSLINEGKSFKSSNEVLPTFHNSCEVPGTIIT